jgi:hypothetical protein
LDCRRQEYRLIGSGLPSMVVELALLSVPDPQGEGRSWYGLEARKLNGESFEAWIRSEGYPAREVADATDAIQRYIFREGPGQALEFRNYLTGEPVLPVLGAWGHLMPRGGEGGKPGSVAEYLGHDYDLQHDGRGKAALPRNVRVLDLRPDLLIGPAHNMRQVDETRRWDGSDYELVPLNRDDYDEMIGAGVTLLRADFRQASWIKDREVFFWGVPGVEIPYPEWLYRSNYLGPTIFLDEPAVCTRDRILRPRLDKEEGFREAITPQIALEGFMEYFREAKHEHAARALINGLSGRTDLDLGRMDFLQENLYTWETMVSSAAYQLGGGAGPPYAVVFEPPGRVGTMRTLPEFNMTYGCHIPVDDPKNLASIIYGFLRGAARATGKAWGMSIYGQFHRGDAFWFQTHAYDLGATIFTYWDSYQLACVPFHEYLALTRNLSAHAEEHPDRDLEDLKCAAEIAILLPAGYNLGHVDLGRGNLWGIPELNLERRNRFGVKYRTVMANFFAEIERCIRLGRAFDLLWDLEGLQTGGYDEVVRIREDGKVELIRGADVALMDGPRRCGKLEGRSPRIELVVEVFRSARGATVKSTASVGRGSAPLYYTVGADRHGEYRNVLVEWELYGPREYDYRFLNHEVWEPGVTRTGDGAAIQLSFDLEGPGNYRLRAATCDMAGRTAVAWREIDLA